MGKVANIKFNVGIVNTPSDVSPMDGDLNECINLVPSDGELKPVEMPVMVFPAGGAAGVLAAVHNGEWGKNFIKVNGRDVWFLDDAMQPVEPRTKRLESDIKWVECVGNTLVIGTEKSTHYALYKNGAYKWLGDVLPRPVFDVRLKADTDNDYYNCTVTNPIPTGVEYPESGNEEGEYIRLQLGWDRPIYYPQGTAFVRLENYSNQAKRYIMNNFNSKLATLLHDIKENGRFIYPFFVRYAIKLYDGSYTSHSAPILMLPSTAINPIRALLVTEGFHRHGTSTSVCGNGNLHLTAQGQPLAYKFKGFYDADNNRINDISEWNDIIEGVDIFLSSEIPTYNVDWHNSYNNIPDDYYTYNPNNQSDIYGLVFHNNTKTPWHLKYFNYASSGVYVRMSTELEAQAGGLDIGNCFKYHIFPITSLEKGEIVKRIKETSIFYKAKEYTINALNSWGNNYKCFHNEVDYGFLTNLETKQVLKDEYLSRGRKTATGHYSYNRRMMLGGLNVEAPNWYKITEKVDEGYKADFELYFEIEKPDKKIVVKASEENIGANLFGHYIYYPDIDCKRVYVHMTYEDQDFNTTNEYYAVLEMSAHTGLNGSYAIFDSLEPLIDYMKIHGVSYMQMPQESSDRYYTLSNALIMSPVSNLFVFNADNSIEVGTGKIMGLATTVIPYSPAQYGQFQIAVFTSNGIHSVGVDSEGKFTSIGLVSSADTLINEPRIGQPNIISDGQVVYFITKRGLMELQGLQAKCVSEILNGRAWDYRDYANSVNASQGELQYQNAVTLLGDGIKDKRSFNQTINDGDAFLAFDYKHNRIIVTDPTRQSHWLYSIGDRKWSKMVFDNTLHTDDNMLNVAQMLSTRGANAVANGRRIMSAVFNWNESYIQTYEGEIWDLMGAADENDDRYYKYGFIASRPIRFGTDDYKSLTRLLHRKRINSQKGFAGIRLYGSVDGITFYEINSLRGASFKYYVVLLYTCMKANERYSYMSVEFEERFQNKLR